MIAAHAHERGRVIVCGLPRRKIVADAGSEQVFGPTAAPRSESEPMATPFGKSRREISRPMPRSLSRLISSTFIPVRDSPRRTISHLGQTNSGRNVIPRGFAAVTTHDPQ